MGRSPHGERGLESIGTCQGHREHLSLPAWGAWVGIPNLTPRLATTTSLPAWGAWVGITNGGCHRFDHQVAPRMGSVGWNWAV